MRNWQTKFLVEEHPNQYWIACFNMSIPVNNCLVDIRIQQYPCLIWCNGILVDLADNLLGLPWFCDREVMSDAKQTSEPSNLIGENTCWFPWGSPSVAEGRWVKKESQSYEAFYAQWRLKKVRWKRNQWLGKKITIIWLSRFHEQLKASDAKHL